jgi:uncharacterized membrane protein YcaP (DUF421 family)
MLTAAHALYTAPMLHAPLAMNGVAAVRTAAADLPTYWNDLFHAGVPLGEKVLRTILVYLFLLFGLRVAGRRELGQLNPFDLVVLLLLSNTVQNAIIGNDNSLIGGVVGAITLLAVNYLVVRFLYSHKQIDRIVEGGSEVLVRDGRMVEPALRKALITEEELLSAARRQGIDCVEDVQEARLETSGNLTFIAKHPDYEERTEDERHRELLDKLERIEQQLARMEARHG